MRVENIELKNRFRKEELVGACEKGRKKVDMDEREERRDQKCPSVIPAGFIMLEDL